MGGNRPNNNNYNPMGGNRGPYEETRNFAVPRDYVGLVIGKQGDTIKRLQSETGANVQFNCTDPHAPGERYVIIQGNKNQVCVLYVNLLYLFFFDFFFFFFFEEF